MNIGPKKAHDTPYGSSVIPTNGTLPVAPPPPRLPGAPSPIPGSLGVAGGWDVRNTVASPTTTPAPTPPSEVAQAVDNLIDAIANRVADKVLAKLATREAHAMPTPAVDSSRIDELDVEDMNRLSGLVGDVMTPEPVLPSESGDATQMHTALEQALREREHVNVIRFAPGPLAFHVVTEGSPLWQGPEGDGSVGYRTCTVYAQPYGRGYTNGAKPNEYVLLCDGRRVSRSQSYQQGPSGFIPHDAWRGGFYADYGAGLTFDEVLAAVDGPLRSATWGTDS